MITSRTISTIVLGLTLAAQTAPAFAYTDSYVSSGRVTSSAAINYVKDHNIMDGYDNGSFGENNRVNRAEFAKIVSLIDSPNSNPRYTTNMSFNDVPTNAWYASYVTNAYRKGWMSGYGDNSFRPTQSITFAEAAKVLAMVYNLRTSSNANVWYEGPARALAARHAIPTSIDTVNDALTRGEIADIVYRLDSNNTNQPSRSYDDVTLDSYIYDNQTSNRNRSNNYCYIDSNDRYRCIDGNFNYDTYYGDNNCYTDSNGRYRCDNNRNNNNKNNCYYDSNNRYVCNNNNTSNNCYYDSNNRYTCNKNDSDCYYDSNGRYRCDDSSNSNDCYYNSSNRYVCDNNNYDDNNGDCVYDSDGKRVCGGSRYNNDNNCYYDSNNRYRCDNNYNDNNDCYYNSNGRYVCDDNDNNDNGDCVYDSDGHRVCGGSRYNDNYYNNNYSNDPYNNDCYYDRNNNYICE
jgi:hypothetical protein